MEELNKLCEELDIDLSNLQTLSDQNKSKLYDILQDNEILIKAKEIGMQPNDFAKRLLINNPMIWLAMPLDIGKEKIINQLERIIWA